MCTDNLYNQQATFFNAAQAPNYCGGGGAAGYADPIRQTPSGPYKNTSLNIKLLAAKKWLREK